MHLIMFLVMAMAWLPMSIAQAQTAQAQTAQAQTETCSEIDLNKDPASLGLVPRWEQGDTQLCYAFTTAQLVDAYRIKKGDLHANQFTSPLVLASQTIQKYHDKGTTYGGGKIEHAFKTAREKGSCNAKYISDRWGKSNAKKIISLLSRCYKKGVKEENKLAVAEQCVQDLLDQEVTRDYLPTTGEFVKHFEESREDFMSAVLSSPCKEMNSLSEIPAPTRYFRPRADTMDMVEKVHGLLADKTPVGVNFCAEAVSDKAHVGHRDEDKKEWICAKGLRHSAIIAGRKMINGKCNFLIRDTGCESLNKSGKYCENGEYWIEDKHLVANSEGLIWLQ
jgi:hypothetical protein